MNSGLGIRWDDLPRLRARAVSLLTAGPLEASRLATELFGFRKAPAAVATRLVREVLEADPRFCTRNGDWLLRDGDGVGCRAPLADLDFAVVDVETTGGAPLAGDRITELAAVRIRGGQVVASFESLVNPGRPIPPAVTALTNISQRMVARAPRFGEVIDELRDVLEGAIFVAHNADFDWRFLGAELVRCRGVHLRGPRVCTLRLARRLHPELPRRSLRALTDYYAIEFDSWHRAGPDARATTDLFVRFLGRLAEDGVEDWAALQHYLDVAPEEDEEADEQAERA